VKVGTRRSRPLARRIRVPIGVFACVPGPRGSVDSTSVSKKERRGSQATLNAFDQTLGVADSCAPSSASIEGAARLIDDAE
jgi:hypothetical protein